jgi:deoxyribodipyrimidine photolyase-related protein
MTIGVWILGDQLSQQGTAISSVPIGTPVILIESLAHVRSRIYHQQKLVLVWSAMRHFATELQSLGYTVTYSEAEDFRSALLAWIACDQITELRLMLPVDNFTAHHISHVSHPSLVSERPTYP